MPESVIITLIWNGQEADFELPAKIPLRGFAEPLLRAMRRCFPGMPPQNVHLRLEGEDGVLDETATLEDHGIFEGAILEAVLTA